MDGLSDHRPEDHREATEERRGVWRDTKSSANVAVMLKTKQNNTSQCTAGHGYPKDDGVLKELKLEIMISSSVQRCKTKGTYIRGKAEVSRKRPEMKQCLTALKLG